ncbi:hypothetical protein [Variovorax paradoxus]|uniref:hypothetical protein n=1 Tax=Variovorax paradoxus TaxID=34073 RepID=UPI003D6620BC
MGCDIHAFCERSDSDGKWEYLPSVQVFDCRSYALFGWLADVRNYSDIEPVAAPRGLPEDVSSSIKAEYGEEDGEAHGASWLTPEELLAVDYDRVVEDRRYIGRVAEGYLSGTLTAEPGKGTEMSLRQFLGERYFFDLAAMQRAGVGRVVFWFDN